MPELSLPVTVREASTCTSTILPSTGVDTESVLSLPSSCIYRLKFLPGMVKVISPGLSVSVLLVGAALYFRVTATPSRGTVLVSSLVPSAVFNVTNSPS